MADVAELKIKPVLAGNTRAVFQPLIGGLKGVGKVAGNIGQTLTGVVKKLTSIPSLVAGFALQGVGRTLLEKTIGSADEMAMIEYRIKGILGTNERLAEVVGRVDVMLKNFPSLNRSDAMAGMEKFLAITGGSIDKSQELLRLAKALEAVSPEQGFEGAMFAIKELMEGSPMSIKSRFGLTPTSPEEAKKAAKKQRKTLSDFYLDEVLDQLGKQYGQEGSTVIDFLIGVKSNSVMGTMQRIQSVISDTFLRIGRGAHSKVLANLGVVADKWTAMAESPEFQQSITSLSEFFADAAGAITGKLPGLIDKIPAAMTAVMDAFKSVAEFYERHPTLIKVLAGAGAANWATGLLKDMGVGAVKAATRAGIGLVAGKKGGAIASVLGGGGGGCCCDGKGGGGGGGGEGAAEQSLFGKVLSKGKNLLKYGTLAAPELAGLTAAETAVVSTSAALRCPSKRVPHAQRGDRWPDRHRCAWSMSSRRTQPSSHPHTR